ncbi:hypothetical protein C9I92_21075 [Photobacterium ganghwense]|uniref:Uncharacterized protein n=1 Tax=Photobacterium ganghwense TaxID=320778 RepID=A0A0J1H0I5_9GAMM|nr:hypothetical protein ABT57_21945 [Photobacterium ganghwense]PSU05770.1 hypothetical protein C9I92_21075 [Photobacterium ganghwense]
MLSILSFIERQSFACGLYHNNIMPMYLFYGVSAVILMCGKFQYLAKTRATGEVGREMAAKATNKKQAS